ncbi:transposase [Tuberibacillus calidus]|jgi:transposase|uniref:transposase n=1 Tax=Tuberibacillus calidus TaxID=340097 RepID=UPI0003F8447F|nr:transposase [Tuberibacillus calidus]
MPIRRQLPRVIAVDEFKGDANKTKFQTIIVDVEKKEIIEVLPVRRVETLEKYFKSISFLVTDYVNGNHH